MGIHAGGWLWVERGEPRTHNDLKAVDILKTVIALPGLDPGIDRAIQ